MVNPEFFYERLKENRVDFFTGVPDYLLKSFCAYLTDKCEENKHIIAVNEGAAIALASGYNIATGKVALVYMQNSGIGNAINPLLSLADPQVYKVPMVFLIGWRGEPGVRDEPQHVKQGEVTLKLLEVMEIPCDIALVCGYKQAYRVKSKEKLINILSVQKESPCLIEIFVKKGARKCLGRPRTSPFENKIALMKMLN
jgi:sulfopyruvate decarboxylase TPP-binding subunit